MSPRLRRIAGWATSHVMGMLAYTALSPVVVAYAFLIAGAFGLLLAGLQPSATDSPGGLADTILLTGLTILDRFRRPDLPFQDNALRIFGMLGILGWLVELVVRRVRPSRSAPRPFLALVKRRVSALGILAVALSSVMFIAMLMVDWAGDPSLSRRVLQAMLTAYGIGAIIFIVSVPPLVLSMGIQAARGPLARMVAEAEMPAPP